MVKQYNMIIQAEEYMIMRGNIIIFEDGIEIFFSEWTKNKDYLLEGWSEFKN